ncbi:MAG: carbohydrate ABC transporter permease [Saccharofermentanales bacterium]
MKKQPLAGIQKMKQYREAYLLMLPFLVVFFVFTVWPVLLSIVLSFTSYNVLEMPRFIGWQNYVRLFVQDEIFSIAVKNTLLFALVTGPVSYILCLLFAWIINELPRRTRTIMTLVFYAPSISGSIYTIWLLVFDGDMYGYLNSFLMKAGFISDPIQWLKNPQYMMAVVILVQLWVSLGTSFLTMRAGFTTIDKQYYEAGAIDGVKNRWQELWFITLPMMAPHLMLAAVLAITASFGAEQVATAMTGFPSTDYATHTVMHHMRDYGSIRYERGYASAIASLLFLTSIGVNRIVQRFLRKVGQ